MPTLPNFLIVGATKCGTSSLHNYLAQHPEVFMSKVKEPRFITSQFTSFPLGGPGDHKVEKWYVKTFDSYRALFEGATGQKAIGESSADTIYFYKDSIPVIKQYHGDPKIIIVLRNPIKRAFSAYQHLVRDERESLSFEDGLIREPDRIRDNFELIYHYTAAGKFYESVKAFMENFSHVKVILTEDLEKNPQETSQSIFEFLGVDPSFRVNAELKYNISGKPKSQWLHNFLFEGHPIRNAVRPIVRMFTSHETRKRLSHKIQAKNLTRMEMSSETRSRLREIFKDDILQLQQLINRDLSAWLK